MIYNFTMETKKELPKEDKRKLAVLNLKYAVLTACVYICSWIVFYLMIRFADLILEISPLILMALYVICFFTAYALSQFIMHTKGIQTIVSGWLKSLN